MAENGNDSAPQQDAPKIIVDDDWKAQAQAEKEKLAKEAEQVQPGAAGGQREFPPASFSVLVATIAGRVQMALGGMVDRRTNQRVVDLDMAKHEIDTLGVLEEKTKGNLTDEEKALLDRAIYETRMIYVQIAQQINNSQQPPQAPRTPGG